MDNGTDAHGGMNIITKAVAVLDALQDRGELTVAEIAESLAEPTSSVYRLLANLDRLAWIERGSRRGSFRLGIELVRLGDSLERQLDIRRIALPELELLNAQTGQTAFLCVNRNDMAACIERIEGQEVQIQRLRIGDSLPLHVGAAPRALLSFQTPAQIAAYAERRVPAEDRAAVIADAAAIRTAGVSIATEEGVRGIASVGAPIFDQRGEVIAALSISGLRRAVLDGGYDPVEVVTSAASRVSALLGYRASDVTTKVP